VAKDQIGRKKQQCKKDDTAQQIARSWSNLHPFTS